MISGKMYDLSKLIISGNVLVYDGEIEGCRVFQSSSDKRGGAVARPIIMDLGSETGPLYNQLMAELKARGRLIIKLKSKIELLKKEKRALKHRIQVECNDASA